MEDLSEKEQIEQLRTWWSDYGNYVLAGIVMGALSLFGYNYFGDSRREAAYAASDLYDQLTEFVADGELDAAESVSDTILNEHSGSAYAAQARLAMARLYMDTNRDADAAAMLNELLGSSANDEYKKVARLRLAKLRLYQDQPAEALALLGEAGASEGAFAARYDEVRGDALVALGRLDEAREAYRRALSESGRDTTVNQEFVQLKLLDLPVQEVPAANEPATDFPGERATAREAAAPDHDEPDPQPGAVEQPAADPPDADPSAADEPDTDAGATREDGE